MTQPKDFSPIRPSVWGLTTTWPLLQRLCEEDPQARGLLDVVVTLRIIPHGIVKLTQIIGFCRKVAFSRVWESVSH